MLELEFSPVERFCQYLKQRFDVVAVGENQELLTLPR